MSAEHPAAQGRLDAKYGGLYRTKDGSDVEDNYFVLIPHNAAKGSYDQAAWAALEAYADACEGYAPDLAAELREWVKRCREDDLLQRCYDAGWER
jgi:hypothetical protein